MAKPYTPSTDITDSNKVGGLYAYIPGYEVPQMLEDEFMAVETALDSEKIIFAVQLVAAGANMTTGEKWSTRCPAAYRITRLYACVDSAPTGTTIELDMEKAGTSILHTTPLMIAATAFSGETSVFASSSTYADVAKGDLLSIDVDQVGGTLPGTGGKVYVFGHPI